MFELRSACTLVLFAGAVALLPPTVDGVREFGSWCLRPARLPFAWQALTSATEQGDSREVFARGQQIMQLVPSWADGHAAFVYRYVQTQDDSMHPDAAAAAAEERLHLGLSMLEAAREHAGSREKSLLHAAAYLPDIACDSFPGLRERMQERGNSAEQIADRYFAEYARLFPTAATREQHAWYAPTLAASLLAMKDRSGALKVLDRAIRQSAEIRDRALATEWRARLVEVARFLRGDTALDRSKVFADMRFEPLWPYIR